MLINAIGQLAAAFLATIAFSVLFHVPKKQYIICGLTGTLGWLVYLLVKLYFSSGLETFKAVAAIVLGIVCVFVIPNKWFRSL